MEEVAPDFNNIKTCRSKLCDVKVGLKVMVFWESRWCFTFGHRSHKKKYFPRDTNNVTTYVNVQTKLLRNFQQESNPHVVVVYIPTHIHSYIKFSFFYAVFFFNSIRKISKKLFYIFLNKKQITWQVISRLRKLIRN